MHRLSIARSLRLALGGLTIALVVVAALGIDSLYSSREHYENALSGSSELAIAAANLESAQLSQYEAVRDARGPAGAAARAEAASDLQSAAAAARSLARSDPTSERLVQAQLAAASPSQAAAAAGAVQTRQQVRQTAARSRAKSDSRRALALVAGAGALALIGAL